MDSCDKLIANHQNKEAKYEIFRYYQQNDIRRQSKTMCRKRLLA